MAGALGGKTVVITGSSRGIGRSIALAAAAEGANVVVSSRTAAAVQPVVDAITRAGGSASGMACDVTSESDLEALLGHAIERWGHLDVWVNNAGVSEGYRPVDELSPDEMREVVGINLVGTMLACRLVVPYMREHGGVLINMAGRGYKGDATPHTASYAATKAAVVSFTRSLAAENKDAPVSIHALVPGMVATDFYRDDMPCSPKLEASRGNIALALDAFGVPLDAVGGESVPILAQTPGASTGKVYSLLKGVRTLRGIALMSWWGMSGKMKRDR